MLKYQFFLKKTTFFKKSIKNTTNAFVFNLKKKKKPKKFILIYLGILYFYISKIQVSLIEKNTLSTSSLQLLWTFFSNIYFSSEQSSFLVIR